MATYLPTGTNFDIQPSNAIKAGMKALTGAIE